MFLASGRALLPVASQLRYVISTASPPTREDDLPKTPRIAAIGIGSNPAPMPPATSSAITATLVHTLSRAGSRPAVANQPVICRCMAEDGGLEMIGRGHRSLGPTGPIMPQDAGVTQLVGCEPSGVSRNRSSPIGLSSTARSNESRSSAASSVVLVETTHFRCSAG